MKRRIPKSGTFGGAALSALLVVLLLSLIGGGAAMVLGASGRFARAVLDEMALEKRLSEAVSRTLSILRDDPTPESDSPNDPVWRELDGLETEVYLQDVSSRINPNTIRPTLLDRTGIGDLIFADSRNAGPGALRQYREDEWLSADIAAHYHDFFSDEALDEFLTGYGWANINVTDEFVLRSIYADRTGNDIGAKRFRSLAVAIIGRDTMITREALRGYLGADFDRVYPVVNAEPLWNVHYLPERVLRKILSYSALGVSDPDGVAAALVALRDSSSLSMDELTDLTGLPESSRLHQYLGVRTWFWKIGAQASGVSLEIVAARIPGESPTFQIVERRIVRRDS